MNTERSIQEMNHLVGGYFEYFKGGTVRLDTIAIDWETKEAVVIYTDVSDCSADPQMQWMRPAKMFFGYVECPEKGLTTRFRYLGKSAVEVNKEIVKESEPLDGQTT